jgi:hypothetical protein
MNSKILANLWNPINDMNINTNKWAVSCVNPNFSEAVQRIAFSFGYDWLREKEHKPLNKTQKYLIFDPSSKCITYCSEGDNFEQYVYKLVFSIYEVVEMFNSPESNVLNVHCDIQVRKDGSIGVKGWGISSTLFDELVIKRDSFLGKLGKTEKKNLPIVSFTYFSKSSGRKMRHVMVTKMDEFGSLEGLDLDDNNKYKKFSAANISGGIILVRFDNKPL